MLLHQGAKVLVAGWRVGVGCLTPAVLGVGLERGQWCAAVGRPELGDATLRRAEGRLNRTEKRIDRLL